VSLAPGAGSRMTLSLLPATATKEARLLLLARGLRAVTMASSASSYLFICCCSALVPCGWVRWLLGATMRAEDVTATLDLALAASGLDHVTVVHRPRLLLDKWRVLPLRRSR
jgi:hypothetical protein